jgi:hypothetical protein
MLLLAFLLGNRDRFVGRACDVAPRLWKRHY